MMKILLPLLVLLILTPVNKAELNHQVCRTSRCRDDGPLIKFPFRLKGDPLHCGNPQFEVFCSSSNMTMIQLSSTSGLFPIRKIFYYNQSFIVYDADGCLPGRLLNFTISKSSLFFIQKKWLFKPFFYRYSWEDPCASSILGEVTLLNCSTTRNFSTWDYNYTPIKCLSAPGHHQVLAVPSSSSIHHLPLPASSCSTVRVGFSRTDFLLSSPIDDLTERYRNPLLYRNPYMLKCKLDDVLVLEWSIRRFPECLKCTGLCEPDYKINKIWCNTRQAPRQTPRDYDSGHASKTRSMIIGVSIAAGFFLILAIMVVVLLYCVRQSKGIEERENQIKIEKFLDDHKSHVPTRFSYADIKKMTNGFKKKLGEGGFGTVFSGRLIPNGVPVAIKVLKDSKGNGEDFVNEVGTIGRIHHLNVVRLVGYSAEGGKRALIYEFMPNMSLEKFISSNDNTNSFDWEKLCKIITGIAKGIEYLHQGCDQRILHFDIKPHNILLDQDFNPKISDFGMAKLCSKEDSVISMTVARGTIGYIAPEVFNGNFGTVSYKSDVYSFGMLVLEVIGARKKSSITSSDSEVYFPELIYKCLIGGEKLDLELGDDEDAQIAKRLVIVALWCIQWYPVNRPSMKAVVRMLEGAFEILIMPPNPFASMNQMEQPATS